MDEDFLSGVQLEHKVEQIRAMWRNFPLDVRKEVILRFSSIDDLFSTEGGYAVEIYDQRYGDDSVKLACPIGCALYLLGCEDGMLPTNLMPSSIDALEIIPFSLSAQDVDAISYFINGYDDFLNRGSSITELIPED